VEFIPADIVANQSGSPVEGRVRTARPTASPSSGVSRKGFQAVLQGVRGEEKKVETRQTDEVRSMSKPDRGLRAKDTKDQDPPSTQTERAEASSSQTSASGESRSSDDETRAVEDSRDAPESTSSPSHASSDSQWQSPVSIVSLMAPQVLAQASDQTTVHPEGEACCSEGEHMSEPETDLDGGASRFPLIVPRAEDAIITIAHQAAGHSPSGEEQSFPHDLPAPASDALVIQNKGECQTMPVVKPEPHTLADEAGPENANRADTRSVTLESKPGSALLDSEALARRVSHFTAVSNLPESKPEVPTIDFVRRDDLPVDRPVPDQINRYAPVLYDDQDNGERPSWMFPQAQSSSGEGAEGFGEFRDDHNSPQHDQAEIKLPQGAVGDRPASIGQSTESIMAGAQGRAGSNPPPSPLAAPFTSQAPPTMPTHDPADQSVRLMTRSVVLDVAQPDLGHVNIRVAMTNDMVHTHLSADRAEVGQFLINGQDRLQAAFQANGLDMGQFRVDIDRQGAGRSFQQGPSQEQGQPWNQGSQGMPWGRSSDREDEPRSSLHGLLNLVA
jgi:hypothetical protein